MDRQAIRAAIERGDTALGVELGSTRIKSVLIGPDHSPIAAGGHEWQNRYEGGIWTYTLDEVWAGLQASYRSLAAEVGARYGTPLRKVGSIGFSAMMHGYLAFDRDGRLLVPFRTWRNTTTGRATAELTRLLDFNIPHRWSIAHLVQALLDGEPHVGDIAYLTTLAGYVHWRTTGRRALGVGDASGMFPIDTTTGDWDRKRMALVDRWLEGAGIDWQLADVLPQVLLAGADAGRLTAEGARLLDPTGTLIPDIEVCPPEGDAGTGMVATNSVAERTGNVSAGTSVFAMFVLERDLDRLHPEIDLVTTPTGRPVAMVHANNCTSDLDAWVGLFQEVTDLAGATIDRSALYEVLYRQALHGDPDGGGLLAYNHLSGEPLVGLDEGRPLVVRTAEGRMTLANLMRVHLFSALGALRVGLDILFKEERVAVDRVVGHGGLFKTPEVGQRFMAAAMEAPVAVMETAGEGGAWGIALLASFRLRQADSESLEEYLTTRVFAGGAADTVDPDPTDVAGFASFMDRYRRGVAIERAAVEALA